MRRLAIFARTPIAGKVKTRLARAIGVDGALAVYQELLALTLARLGPGSGNFASEIWVDGDSQTSDAWRSFPVFAQPDGDLGKKMAAAFSEGVAAIVGSDIPDMTAGYADAALAALAGVDVVLGPTEDGGYCLIAMKEPHPEVFVGIPWGTGRVLAATRYAARHLSVTILDTLWDVDEAADLERWRMLRRQRTPSATAGKGTLDRQCRGQAGAVRPPAVPGS